MFRSETRNFLSFWKLVSVAALISLAVALLVGAGLAFGNGNEIPTTPTDSFQVKMQAYQLAPSGFKLSWKRPTLARHCSPQLNGDLVNLPLETAKLKFARHSFTGLTPGETYEVRMVCKIKPRTANSLPILEPAISQPLSVTLPDAPESQTTPTATSMPTRTNITMPLTPITGNLPPPPPFLHAATPTPLPTADTNDGRYMANLRATEVTDTTITIAWEKPPFAIACTPVLDGTSHSATTEGTHTFTGLTAGTQYVMQVTCTKLLSPGEEDYGLSAPMVVKTTGNAPATTPAPTATPDPVPSTPIVLGDIENFRLVDKGPFNLEVAWDEYPGAEYYQVSFKRNGRRGDACNESDWTEIHFTSYDNQFLQSSTRYLICIRALNEDDQVITNIKTRFATTK